MSLLSRMSPGEVQRLARDPVDRETLAAAEQIVDAVRAGGEPALREAAERLGDIQPGAPLYLDKAALQAALDEIPAEAAALLSRTAARIKAFATAQRDSLKALSIPAPGGVMGHDVAPMERAGCYAPGGRYPLPSSVLMTAVTARAAGVKEVWVASPRPTPIVQAAAAIAGADGLLTVGGAQAIAALTFGAGPVPACDAICGPGNRWVTAAKQLVSGRVVIDMLAGPSEVLIIADDSADPAVVAADMLAQCEHDPDASAVLLSTSAALIDGVETELAGQLPALTSAEIAGASLKDNSFAVLVEDLDQAGELANLLAPEHLELQCVDPEALRPKLKHYGALFVGDGSAEALGDYGVGPNHVLPTGGTARAFGGLSVFTFLRVRTFLDLEQAEVPPEIYEDAGALADLEGLPAHAASARRRLPKR